MHRSCPTAKEVSARGEHWLRRRYVRRRVRCDALPFNR
nr:MAG TPA: hypothetical protein [Caudoviricetes sp.]DAM75484.1 MAG TPA: hypothetical protein [Caudoviricetes sp.]